MFSKPRLFTPGPTLIPEEVKLEMAKEMLHHRKVDFKRIYSEVQEKLKILFGTAQPVLILTSSGTGAMQAAVSNLFSPKEKVLVVVGGKFGKRWKEIAQVFDLVPVLLEVEWGNAVKVDQIDEKLKQHPDIKGVLVQASETSTGVLHPVKEIGDLLKDKEALLVVDGISAVGVSPCPMDKWHVDCLITGSQKGLMVPPGLSMISLSEKAWEKAKKVKKRDFYFDLLGERKKCIDNQTLFTPSVVLIRGLDKALDLILKNGLEGIYKKQWALTCMVRKGVVDMGLEPMVKENFTWGLTSVFLPEGIDGQGILKILAEDYNVIIAGGQENLKGKIIRIGHMGNVDWMDLLGALCALKEVLQRECDLKIKPNFLEEAFDCYVAAIKHTNISLD